MNEDTRDVRPTERLDWAALEAYLRTHLADAAVPNLDLSAPMHVAQFPGGHSNLTYLVRFGDVELVLRRPPLGPVPPKAHDMAREYRWLAAMNPVFPLAPRVYLLCEDPAVLGSVFYIMERRRGIVIRREEPPEIADKPAVRRRVSEAMIDTLASLHSIDVTGRNLSSPNLSSLGKPIGFVERQVRGWTDRWVGSRLDPVADMETLSTWLVSHLPPEPERPAVVHGDFKLDNVLLDAHDPGRIAGVFDWEMSALGDPLVDVGILLAYWSPTSPPSDGDALTTVTHRPGWFSREEIIEQYAKRSGRDVSRIRFYETFALFKIAVVIQQIYYRYVRGQTDDTRFAHFGERVKYLAGEAAQLI